MSYSSLGKRFVGYIIDSVVVNCLAAFFILFSGEFGFVISTGVLSIIYYTLMMGSSWHATIGQRVFNMQVVDRHGVGIAYSQAVVRALCFWLSALLFWIGFIIALFSDRKQTLHDRLAETYVVDGASGEKAKIINNTAQGKIIGISGEKAGAAYMVPSGGIMIGRDPAVCQIVMSNTPGVSRCHCYVTYSAESGMYIVTDHNSSYGTYTQSDVRISSHSGVALRRGDRFYIGSRQNMFECC